VSVGTIAAGVALVITGSLLGAQEHGPTVTAARAAFAAPATAGDHEPPTFTAPASCGSALKNAALLGLGLSLATAVLELTYTFVREPFVRNGHDLPGADPTIIAWAGAAGFIGGLVGTELCRRRR
jgi:hypothetical protein